MGKHSFSERERLKKDSLIKEVFDKGVILRARSVNVYILERPGASFDLNRVAFTSRRRLHNGKTVLRNRIRRILREAYRKTKDLLPQRYDIVILATRITQKTKSIDIEKELRDVFKRHGKK